MLSTLSYVATIIAIIGTIANSLKLRWSFYVWIISNSFWIGYNLYNDQRSQAALYAVNLITCIIGLIKWQKRSYNED